MKKGMPQFTDKETGDEVIKQAQAQSQSQGVYECSLCKKKFNYKNGLIRHVRLTHVGEKPYQCNICNRRFGYKHILMEHQNLHFGNRPYACNLCDKKFAARSNLIQHRTVHKKPYNCSMCNKRFDKEEQLKKHLFAHPQALLSCNFCNYAAASQSDLNRHMIEQHPPQVMDTRDKRRPSSDNNSTPSNTASPEPLVDENNSRTSPPTQHEPVSYSIHVNPENGANRVDTIAHHLAHNANSTASTPNSEESAPNVTLHNIIIKKEPDLGGYGKQEVNKPHLVATHQGAALHTGMSNRVGGGGEQPRDMSRHLAGTPDLITSPPTSLPSFSTIVSTIGLERHNGMVVAKSDSRPSPLPPLDISRNDIRPTPLPAIDEAFSRRRLMNTSLLGAPLPDFRFHNDHLPPRSQYSELPIPQNFMAMAQSMAAQFRESHIVNPPNIPSSSFPHIQPPASVIQQLSPRGGDRGDLTPIQSPVSTQRPTQDVSVQHTSPIPGYPDLDDVMAYYCSQGRLFKCQYCNIIFFERGMYFLHASLHGSSSPWECGICHKLCADKNEFTLHFVNQQHT